MGCGASNTASQVDDSCPPVKAADVEALKEKLAQQDENEDTNNIDKLSTIQQLSEGLQSQGNIEEALPLSRRAVQGRRAELGLVHPDTLASVKTLATCLGCSPDNPPSEDAVSELRPLYEEVNNQLKSAPKDVDTLTLHKVAYDGCSAALGPGHKTSLKLRSSLATRLDNSGNAEEALESYRSVLETQRKQLGSYHLSTLATMMNYGALVLVQEKNGKKAAQLLKQAAEGYREKLGPEDKRTQAAETWLKKALQAEGSTADEDAVSKEQVEGKDEGEDEGEDEELMKDQKNEVAPGGDAGDDLEDVRNDGEAGGDDTAQAD